MTTTATSSAAAESIKPAAPLLRRQVCQFIASQGLRGATDEECQIALGMNPSTQRPRRIECQRAGLVTDELGEVRQTTSGRNATVWHITDVGRRACGVTP